jgi:peptide/nickel transport system permease protein
MGRFVARRLVAMVVVLFIILVITFAIFYVFPANPAIDICGKGCTAQSVAVIDKQLGLDHPIYEQFYKYVSEIFVGATFGQGNHTVSCNIPCLGFSYQENLPVTTLLRQHLPVSISIAIGAAVIWLIFGVGLGTIAALRKNTWMDKGVTSIALGGIALPVFLVGIVLLYLVTAKLNWLPDPYYESVFKNPLDFAKGLIQPWVALALVYAAIYVRFTRARLIEVMEEPYVTTARAKGLRERRVVTHHGLRAALTPVVTIFGMDLGGLLGGAVVVETLYGLPGIGQLFILAVGRDDTPVVLGVTLVAAFFVVVANLVVDILYAVLDPRVRY